MLVQSHPSASSALAPTGIRLDARRMRVFDASGRAIALAGRPLELLIHLARNADRVVDKDELLATVWAGRVVEENTLAQAVSSVRRALGAGAGDRLFILTVPGRGYRWLAPCEWIDAAAPAATAAPLGRLRAWPALVLGLLLVLPAALPQRPLEAALPAPRSEVAERGCDDAGGASQREVLAVRHLLLRASPGRLAEARATLERTLRRDPVCAIAHAQLAAYHVKSVLHADGEPAVHFAQARLALGRALALNPDLAEAHLVQAQLAAWTGWQFERARAPVERALALDPDLAEAHLLMALVLRLADEEDWGRLHVRRALQLAPLTPDVLLAQADFLREEVDASAEQPLATALALEPNYWGARFDLAHRALAEGDYAEAVEQLEMARADNDSSLLAAHHARALVLAGQPEAAREIVLLLQQRRTQGYVPGTSLAIALAAIGQSEAALDALERGFEERDVRMLYFAEARSLASLRGQPRFEALAARVAEVAAGSPL
jgi:DNA-binding winged helix-turn-helix (wHTH) protein/tetratricopeptide (TPR) repeat protein